MDLALQSAFLAEASTLLILLAGTVLLYRRFRDTYLVCGIARWTVYGLSRLFAALAITQTDARLWAVLDNVCFSVAIALFAASVLRYVYKGKFISYTTGASGVALVLGIFIALGFSNASLFEWSFLGILFLALALAAACLVHFALGRHNIGHWILAVSLLLLHPDMSRQPHGVAGFDILI